MIVVCLDNLARVLAPTQVLRQDINMSLLLLLCKPIDMLPEFYSSVPAFMQL